MPTASEDPIPNIDPLAVIHHHRARILLDVQEFGRLRTPGDIARVCRTSPSGVVEAHSGGAVIE